MIKQDFISKYIQELNKKRMLVEDIQDIIEQKLMEIEKFELFPPALSAGFSLFSARSVYFL